MEAKLLSVQYLEPTTLNGARVRVSDGKRYMVEAYDYVDLNSQLECLMKKFISRFHPEFEFETLTNFKGMRFAVIKRS